MVEYTNELNAVFRSLSDPTRRDILKRLSKRSMSVGEIAKHYDLSFAAIAKHLDVLERAHLVNKVRKGKEQIVTIAPRELAAANNYLENYREVWEGRLDRLNILLSKKKTKERSGDGKNF